MIFFVGNDGTIVKGLPSPVYQGAANSNTIYLIAPFASNTAVTVAFRLPNGVVTSPAAMTAQNALQGIVNAETGQTYAGWTYDLPNGITELYGTVTVQFFFYSAEAGVITPTSSTSFEVGRGVPAVLPDTPEDDVYENILSNLAALQTQLNNGAFAARAIYNWNASYTYGAGEVTFYPDIGTYGAFVKSVQAGNTNHAPYTDGAVNSAWWSEVVNFNTVTDDFFAEIKAVQTAAEAAQSAAETAQGKAEDAQAAAEEAESGAQTQAQAAASSATAAEESAVQAQTNAGEASASATAAAESAAAASGSESAAAEAAGSASKSAEEAAASAGEAASSASSAQAAQAAAEKAKESVEASADAAAKSAESARASATAAGNSATAAAGSAGAAESAKAAAQTAQNAAESAEGNAQAYAGQASSSAGDAAQSASAAAASANRAQEIVNGIGSVYKPVGSIAFSALPAAPAAAQQGYVYNMTDAFTTDARFVEGVGKEYPAGTNVAVVLNGSAYMYDALSGNVDLSNYAQTDGTYPNMAVGNASNAENAEKASQDAAGNDIPATYAKQTGTYPNMSVGTASEAGYADAAASADTAGYATTAKGDASGNDIEATYATKEALTEGLAGKQPTGNYALQNGTYPNMTVGNATQAGSANDPSAVHFTAQTLTDEQKAQARTNIGVTQGTDGLDALTYSDICTLTSVPSLSQQYSFDRSKFNRSLEFHDIFICPSEYIADGVTRTWLVVFEVIEPLLNSDCRIKAFVETTGAKGEKGDKGDPGEGGGGSSEKYTHNITLVLPPKGIITFSVTTTDSSPVTMFSGLVGMLAVMGYPYQDGEITKMKGASGIIDHESAQPLCVYGVQSNMIDQEIHVFGYFLVDGSDNTTVLNQETELSIEDVVE